MKIDIKGVSITLTKEQIEEIHRQTNKFKSVKDINNYKDACEILDEQFLNGATCYEQLNTIIRAVNFIDNGYKIWKPKFDGNSYNYYPYFKEVNNSLVFFDSRCRYIICSGRVGFYLKEETSSYIGKKFINLYQEIYNKY